MQSSTCAFGHQRDVISKSRTIHQHLFSDFHSPVKEKGKQGRMKGLTMAQWINLNRNNGESIFCIVRKNWPYPPITSGSYGRQGGRPADKIQVDFEILKLFYKNYSDSTKTIQLLFCLISLQFYCSIRTAFTQTE